MARTLLHIGAGRLDANALHWAHEAGLEVLATDPSETAHARQRCDRFAAFEHDDVHGIERWARKESTAQVAAVYSSERTAQDSVARLAEAFGLARGAGQSAHGAGRGLADRNTSGGPRTTEFVVNGFFRDDCFVRGGISELRYSPEGRPRLALQGRLPDELEQQLYGITDQGARELDLTTGPVGARIRKRANGTEVVELMPFFLDPMLTGFVTPLAMGKSPFQAWFAALLGTGGPFDSMPPCPSRWAGWMAIRPDDSEAGTLLSSDHAVLLESVEGLDRARALHGIEGACTLVALGSVCTGGTGGGEGRDAQLLGYLWGVAEDAEELEGRLQAAREKVGIRLIESSAA